MPTGIADESSERRSSPKKICVTFAASSSTRTRHTWIRARPSSTRSTPSARAAPRTRGTTAGSLTAAVTAGAATAPAYARSSLPSSPPDDGETAAHTPWVGVPPSGRQGAGHPLALIDAEGINHMDRLKRLVEARDLLAQAIRACESNRDLPRCVASTARPWPRSTSSDQGGDVAWSRRDHQASSCSDSSNHG